MDGRFPAYTFVHIQFLDDVVHESSGDVLLHSVTINKRNVTGTLTIYDASSVASADTSNDIAVIDVIELNGRMLVYDCILRRGLVTKYTGIAGPFELEADPADITLAYLKL